MSARSLLHHARQSQSALTAKNGQGPPLTVEHPFGTIKQWMNQGAFLMRGPEKVRGEFSLTALAYNLRRVLNIV